MRWISDLYHRLRALVAPGTLERELDDEMAFHLEMETRKHVERGLTPDEARRRALASFGNVDRHKQRARDAWGVTLAQDVKADARFAGRQLRRHPAFAALAALTLALGIGGTVALWSVVYGLLVRPLPFADEGRLVVFWSPYDWRGVEVDFARDRVRAYDALAAFTKDATSWRQGETTTLLHSTAASAELFDVLGARPLLGRTFEPADDRPGAPPVVVVSHGLWRQELGGDPDVIGRSLTLGGVPTTIVGVMPPGFYFPYPVQRAWTPLRLDPASEEYSDNGYLNLVGRVKADVGPARLDADVAALAAALGERFDYPDAWDKAKGAHVTPLREVLLGDVRPALLLLMGAVGLLLLMACANVAALLVARTADRGAEMAVRAALGAGRGRLARQVLTESAILGLVAGVGGAVMAAGLFDVLVASLPLENGLGEALALDWTTFAGALALALAAAGLVAAAPIRGLFAGRLEGHLGGERRETGGAGGGGRLHKSLVVAEVLLAVTLVVGAALLIRTVARLRAVDPGVDPTGVLAADLMVGEQEMGDDERRAFFDAIVRRVAALPGVRSAALTNRLLLRDDGWQGPVAIEDRPDLADARRPNSYYRTATPDFFRALGIELRRGRVFDERDRADAPPVAVVSESFAARIWPGQDPLGKRIDVPDGEERPVTVVGVVEEARITSLIGANPLVVYRPQGQRRWPGLGNVLIVKSELAPSTLAASVRAAVAELDPRVAVARVGPMDDVVAAAIAEPVRLRFFLTLFAFVGLVLGTVGVYGVVSYGVARRRAEFGIRMALGASPSAVWGQVVRQGLVPVVLGIAGGVGLSLALARLLASFLYEVAPGDPASFGTAAGVLLAAGVVASLVPAWRAGRVDPSEVLRAE